MRRTSSPSREVLVDLRLVQKLSLIDIGRRYNRSVSCVHLWLKKYDIYRHPRARHDLAGQVFGRLTVIRELPDIKEWGVHWLCKCECGNERIVTTGPLVGGKAITCAANHHRQGKNNPLWKGGRWIDKKAGYVVIRMDSKRIFEHRWIMEKMLGRFLYKNENVHHKNGIRHDNRPENLELWVKSQPCGQRPSDVVVHAVEMLNKYAPEKLRDLLDNPPSTSLDWSI